MTQSAATCTAPQRDHLAPTCIAKRAVSSQAGTWSAKPRSALDVMLPKSSCTGPLACNGRLRLNGPVVANRTGERWLTHLRQQTRVGLQAEAGRQQNLDGGVGGHGWVLSQLLITVHIAGRRSLARVRYASSLSKRERAEGKKGPTMQRRLCLAYVAGHFQRVERGDVAARHSGAQAHNRQLAVDSFRPNDCVAGTRAAH